MKKYPYNSGRIDIFGDEIWLFTPEAENDPDYSPTYANMEEFYIAHPERRTKKLTQNMNKDTGGEIATATEIRNQIGRQALFMLGAYDIFADKGALGFKIRGSKKWKHIKIRLNGKDLYDVTFTMWKKYDLSDLKEETIKDVYVENLHSVIEKETGLYTKLAGGGKTKKTFLDTMIENHKETIANYEKKLKQAREKKESESVIRDIRKNIDVHRELLADYEKRLRYSGWAGKTGEDFERGTPVYWGDLRGEVIERDGKRAISLYPDKNYAGSSERIVFPTLQEWNYEIKTSQESEEEGYKKYLDERNIKGEKRQKALRKAREGYFDYTLASGGVMEVGGKILKQISTHKAVLEGDKIRIYQKGLPKSEATGELKEMPWLFLDTYIYSIPKENEDDLFAIFEGFEEDNRINRAEANKEFGSMAGGGTITKVIIQSPASPNAVYATLEKDLGDKVETNEGTFDKKYVLKQFEAPAHAFKAEGGNIKTNTTMEQAYYIFNGFDHFNNKPLYRVESTANSENEYVGEWNTDRADAQKELDHLNKNKSMEQGGKSTDPFEKSIEERYKNLDGYYIDDSFSPYTVRGSSFGKPGSIQSTYDTFIKSFNTKKDAVKFIEEDLGGQVIFDPNEVSQKVFDKAVEKGWIKGNEWQNWSEKNVKSAEYLALKDIFDYAKKKGLKMWAGGKLATGGKLSKVFVFDNGGKTIDRYTIILKDGDIYNASENPSMPTGVGSYSHNVTDRMNTTFGYGWREGRDEKSLNRILRSELNNYLNEARGDSSFIGKEVKDLTTLPDRVKEFIVDIQTEEVDRKELGGLLLAGLVGTAIGGALGYGYRDNITKSKEQALANAKKRTEATKARIETQKQAYREKKEKVKRSLISSIEKFEGGGKTGYDEGGLIGKKIRFNQSIITNDGILFDTTHKEEITGEIVDKAKHKGNTVYVIQEDETGDLFTLSLEQLGNALPNDDNMISVNESAERYEGESNGLTSHLESEIPTKNETSETPESEIESEEVGEEVLAMKGGGKTSTHYNRKNWDVQRSSVGDKNGWAFSNHTNVTFGLYKRRDEAETALDKYLETGKLDLFGSAEMATGGKIKDQYKGKSPSQVWDMWTTEQKLHFYRDHRTDIENSLTKEEKKYYDKNQQSIEDVFKSNLKDVPAPLKDAIAQHIHTGQYESGGLMASGGKVSGDKEKLQEEIKILENALDNSFLDDATKEKAKIKIVEKEEKIKAIEAEENKEKNKKKSIEDEKKMHTQNLKDKRLSIDIEKELTLKMRNALHNERIPYSSKTSGDTFRVFLSNRYQLEIVTNLYNDIREKNNMEPIEKEEAYNVIKNRVNKFKSTPVKVKPAIASKLKVDKKRGSMESGGRSGNKFVITSKNQPNELFLGHSVGGKNIQWVEEWRKPIIFTSESEANEFNDKVKMDGIVISKSSKVDKSRVKKKVVKTRSSIKGKIED